MSPHSPGRGSRRPARRNAACQKRPASAPRANPAAALNRKRTTLVVSSSGQSARMRIATASRGTMPAMVRDMPAGLA